MIYTKVKHLIFILLMTYIGGSKIHAQNNTHTYDLSTFVEQVKTNNRQIKIIKGKYQLADITVKEARSAMLPQINVQTGIKRFFNDQYTYFEAPDYANIDPVTGEVPQTIQKFKMGFNNDFQAHLVLQQSLLNLKNIYELQAAKQYSEIGKLQQQNQTIKILAEAKKMFLQAALLKKVLDVSIDSESFAKENYNSNKHKFNQGLISELDLLQAKILWENEVAKLHNAKRNYKMILENLKIVAGIDANNSMAIEYNFSTSQNYNKTVSPKNAINKRYDYQLVEKNLLLKKKSIQAQKANYLPTLDLEAGHSYFSNSDVWSITQNQNKFTYVGLTLTIPIYSGGYRNAQIKKAKIEMNIADEQKQEVIQQMTIEIKNLEHKILEEQKAIEAAKIALKTSKKAYQIMLQNVNDGLVSQLDVRKMSADLKRAEINYYNSIYTLECSLIDYKIAIANY